MCGIAGYIYEEYKPEDRALLTRMCEAMIHRGPDDFGVFFDRGIALGHRRLSIIDLSPAGHQPMANEDGSLWLVYNGEIYNFIELAAELKKAGHVFRSQTDSEVILHLYEEKGADCVNSLNGMFAFAIWDKKNRTLFAARDRLGIKPFFFRTSDSHFIFASEIKAILQDKDLRREPDPYAVSDYLYCGMPLAGKTMFKGIYELPPGHTLTCKDKRLKVDKYWDISYEYGCSRSEEDLVEVLVELLADSVRIHCRSDAPLGCHLSGGMDSSTVTCLASRYRETLKTFSIKFGGSGYFDETPHAKSVASYVGAQYIESIPEGKDLAGMFPFLIYHNEAPMQNIGAFAYYTVSELASRHVKVSLTGHGGDEIFAGYPAQFQAAYGKTDMFVLPSRPDNRQSVFSKALRAFARYGLRGTAWRAAARLKPRPPSFEDLWAALHCSYLPQENPLIHPAFIRDLQDYSPKDEYLKALKYAPTEVPLDRCLYHDAKVYLPGLLQMEDRVSMAVSIESRVPLLDYRVVELMATALPEHKIGDFEPKHLLRNAAKNIVPETILERKDKSPFPVPVDKWLSEGLSGMVQDMAQSSAFRSREIFDSKKFDDADVSPDALWSAINLELWFRIFIDRDLGP